TGERQDRPPRRAGRPPAGRRPVRPAGPRGVSRSSPPSAAAEAAGRGGRATRRQIMRTRLGPSRAVAAVAVRWGSPPAQAGYFGATKYSGASQSAAASQTSFVASQTEAQPGYHVVYDNAVEKRYHTVYQDTCETVMKPVTRTCYR